MQNAETVVDILRARGRRGLPCDELYRQLFNPALFLMFVWRASHFPDCGSFRILSWKGPVNCQEKSRIIPRNSAMKPPAW